MSKMLKERQTYHIEDVKNEVMIVRTDERTPIFIKPLSVVRLFDCNGQIKVVCSHNGNATSFFVVGLPFAALRWAFELHHAAYPNLTIVEFDKKNARVEDEAVEDANDADDTDDDVFGEDFVPIFGPIDSVEERAEEPVAIDTVVIDSEGRKHRRIAVAGTRRSICNQKHMEYMDKNRMIKIWHRRDRKVNILKEIFSFRWILKR